MRRERAGHCIGEMSAGKCRNTHTLFEEWKMCLLLQIDNYAVTANTAHSQQLPLTYV